jgi:phenylacetic acid degradation operon negative regulatory protein
MAKLLNLKDYVLLVAALTGDFFDEVRLVGGLVPSAMKERYGFVPENFKKASYLSTVSRLLSTGDIRRVIGEKGEPLLELTSQGKKKFKRRFPLFALGSGKWDGFFMIVVFDVPEKRRHARNSLRSKLSQLGFGKLQESVWISPYHFEEDLQEFLEANGFAKYCYVLKVKSLFIKDIKELAKRIWRLEEINKRYLTIARRVKEVSERTSVQEESKEIWRLYWETLSLDPFLPDELLPEDWARETAVKSMEKLHLILD